jgi:hypothetical protein
MPIHIANCILGLAKMKLSKFVFVMDKFVGRDRYTIVQCDTDSLYVGLPAETFDESVLPEMREEYELYKDTIFVQCNTCKKDECVNRNCDKRTLGLMKEEVICTHSVALTSKTHTFATVNPLKFHAKLSAKGVPNKTIPVDSLALYYDTLIKKESFTAPVSMRQLNKIGEGTSMVRKTVQRTGVTCTYNNKRKLMDDGIHTEGLDFEVFCGTPKKSREFYDEREARVVRNLTKLRQDE